MPMENIRIKRRKNRAAAAIGGICILLCLIGLIAVIRFAAGGVRDLIGNTAKKEQYEEMLLPVVMFDPVPFEGAENIDPISILQSCIWATAMNADIDTYQYDDLGRLVIPASDVDITARRLFGPNAVLEHQSFDDYDISYYFDEEIMSYRVPVATLTGYYTPTIEEINKTGEIIQLRIGYIPPATALTISVGSQEKIERAAVKHMIYELRKANGEYYLYAIRNEEGAGYIPGQDISVVIPDDALQPTPDLSEPGENTNILPQEGNADGVSSGAVSSNQNVIDQAGSVPDSTQMIG